MSDDHSEGWGHRLFLFLMAALLLSGLLLLGVKMYRQASAPTPASTFGH